MHGAPAGQTGAPNGNAALRTSWGVADADEDGGPLQLHISLPPLGLEDKEVPSSCPPPESFALWVAQIRPDIVVH